ncbi:MAG: hypothetical protein JW878_00395 [Methanomicrobia archaeon]|nr:hypothetical protein [Methanomicrobia archaeon]
MNKMLICDDCVNYFLGCPVSSYPIRYGLCELCGNKAHCYDMHIQKNKTNVRNKVHTTADIIRETIRMLYYPDIDKNDGLKLADYTIRKVSGRTPEELAELVLKKEVKDK